MKANEICVVLSSEKGAVCGFSTRETYSILIEGGHLTVEAVKDGVNYKLTVPVENAEIMDSCEFERRSNTWRYR